MKVSIVTLLITVLSAPLAFADNPVTPDPNVDPHNPPEAPISGPTVPACSYNGKDISTDTAAILSAIKASEFCWQAVQLAESCAAGEGFDTNFVNAAAPLCQKQFEANRPTAQDRALLASMRTACDGKWKGKEGTQYLSANAYCKLNAWNWMVNLTSENGR